MESEGGRELILGAAAASDDDDSREFARPSVRPSVRPSDRRPSEGLPLFFAHPFEVDAFMGMRLNSGTVR